MKISVNVKGLDSTIKSLEKVINNVEQGLPTALNNLADIGSNNAQMAYDTAQRDGNDSPIIVNVQNTGQYERTIVASGEQVAFVEFGTGILNEESPVQASVEGIVRHGGYGKGNGANPWGWFYKGNDERWHRTLGINAQNCLYNAGKLIEREAERIIREVFK